MTTKHYHKMFFLIFVVVCVACSHEQVSEYRKKRIQIQDIDIQVESITNCGKEVQITYVVKSKVERILYVITGEPELPHSSYQPPKDEIPVIDWLTGEPLPPIFWKLSTSMPLLTPSKDGQQLEIWMGIPPLTEIEDKISFPFLTLPTTIKLSAGMTYQQTIVLQKPFWLSGYFVRNIKELESFNNKKVIEAVLVVGYGYTPIDGVYSETQLYQWQLIAQSEIFRIGK